MLNFEIKQDLIFLRLCRGNGWGCSQCQILDIRFEYGLQRIMRQTNLGEKSPFQIGGIESLEKQRFEYRDNLWSR